jgi:hypothetical protein
VERSTWTDNRLDDRFDHVDRELSLLRSDMREGFSGVRGEINGVRGEINEVRGEISGVRGEISGVRGEINGVRGEINDLRLVIIRGNWTVMAGLIGVIAAILARGA